MFYRGEAKNHHANRQHDLAESISGTEKCRLQVVTSQIEQVSCHSRPVTSHLCHPCQQRRHQLTSQSQLSTTE